MNRFEQDAADELAAHEEQREWRERAKADWERSNQPAPTKTWAPVHTEQQKEEQAHYIKRHMCPF